MGRRVRRSNRHRHKKVARAAVGLLAMTASARAASADPSDPTVTIAAIAPPATRPAGAEPIDELATADHPLPTTPGDHKLKFRTHVNGKVVDMTYLLHLPAGYDQPGVDHRVPLLVFLHGSGEMGADLAGVYAWGPPSLLRKNTPNPVLAATFPFAVLAPQCPPRGQRWDMDYMTKAVSVLVDSTLRRSPTVDPDRVYLTGLSMGALGTWCLAELTPDRFAAIAPMNGLDWHPEIAGPALRTVPVWASVGLNDESKFVDATRAMEAALAGAPVERRFGYLVGNGHDAFWPTYQDPDFYEWLLHHRRPSAAARERLAIAPPPPVDTPVPSTPGHHLGTIATRVGDQACRMDYTVYLPPGYEPGKRYPTLLFLREADTIGPAYDDLCVHGPDLALERSPTLRDRFPFVIVSPHIPVKCDWQTPGMTETLLNLLDRLGQGGLGIDPDRVIATGVDAGGNGTWKLVSEAPDRFAAAVTVETNIPVPLTDAEMLPVIHAVPGRAYTVAGDTASPGRVGRLAAGRDWKVAELPKGATALGDLPVYAEPGLLTWMANQSRPSPTAAAR